ncbi:hypothetical protein WME73_33320 [Sorangium sp. So ce302]|uniref:hypothetical protein n=1 Tax=Sorangium sp. So ce302 TaxID=3133297 RepID=UPI003F628EFB
MSNQRRNNTSDMPRSGNVNHLSARERWELAWVRRLGLEDVQWDAERYCEHCRAERAAREEAAEDIAKAPGSRSEQPN